MENGRRETRKRKQPIGSYSSESQLSGNSVTFHEWPQCEKVALLNALKKYGHYDMVNLCKAVPGKTKDQIKMAISMWWKAARLAMQASASGDKRDKEKLKLVPKKGKGRPSGPSKVEQADKTPIDQWLHKFEESQPAVGYPHTRLLSKVFLYISKYENHPSPEDCNGVDYRAMYEYLHCMLSGFPGKTLNPETAMFVLKSLNDMAVEIRERGMQKETFFLDYKQRITGQVRQYVGKKKQTQPDPPDSSHITPEAVFKNLIQTEGFNPLNVPIDLLKK